MRNFNINFNYEKDFVITEGKTTDFGEDLHENRIFEQIAEGLKSEKLTCNAIKTIAFNYKNEKKFIIVEIEGYKALVWEQEVNSNIYEGYCYPFDEEKIYPMQKIRTKVTWY